MRAPMTCPWCHAGIETGPLVRNLLVCPTCRRSIALTDEGPRLAVSADTEDLTQAEMDTLKLARHAGQRLSEDLRKRRAEATRAAS